MHDYQREFLEFAIARKVLRFGEFELKSGRVSPYFFDAGLFNTGLAASRLGAFYADAIVESDLEFDMLFGPAYKGIPLAVLAAAALAERHAKDVPFAYNRKEAKDHGEGGAIIGAPLRGRVLIVDDVITAGTAIRESIGLISAAGATPAGVVISLDREERGRGSFSAVREVRETFGLPVASIVGLGDLLAHLERAEPAHPAREAIREYRDRFGV